MNPSLYQGFTTHSLTALGSGPFAKLALPLALGGLVSRQSDSQGLILLEYTVDDARGLGTSKRYKHVQR